MAEDSRQKRTLPNSSLLLKQNLTDHLNAKRVNLIVPQEAYREVIEAANRKRWSLTQFILFALALAVRVLEETGKGNRLFLKSSDGEQEILVPRW